MQVHSESTTVVPSSDPPSGDLIVCQRKIKPETISQQTSQVLSKKIQHRSPKLSRIGLIIRLITLFILTGILGAILLPNFLKCYPKIGLNASIHDQINKIQIDYFNKNQVFANSLEQMDLTIITKVKNYKTFVKVTENLVWHLSIAQRKDPSHRSYLSAVFSQNGQTQSIICQIEGHAITKPENLNLQTPFLVKDGFLTCPANTLLINHDFPSHKS